MTIGTETAGIDHSKFRFKDNMKQPNREQTTNHEPIKPYVESSEEDVISLDRGMRNLRYTDLLDKMRTTPEDMTASDKEQVNHSLERRKWGGVLRSLHKGDTVVSTLSSTSDLLSIKNLNDNIFGPQTTDSIIAKRRQLTESFLNLALNRAGVSADDLEHVSLEQNYKFGVFNIPAKYNIDVLKVFNNVCAQVDVEMKKFIIKLADEEESKSPEKRKVLQNFRVAVNEQGYKMTFGTAKVESDDLAEIISAANGSLQTARAATFEGFEGYGDDFSAEKMNLNIDQISELRNKLYQNGNSVVGKDGLTYNIFNKKGDKLELDRDLLREVRKDKFKVQPGQEQVLIDLKAYVKSLNIFDVVKPFTADEIDKIKDENLQIDVITKNVTAGNAEYSAQAADILDQNEKDEHYTSESRFHAEAVKNKNCAYLSLDVLDVGVDQLLDFEHRTQMVANKEISFAQASLEAGDLMTNRLRQMRERVFDICEEFKITKNGRMDGLVGGDELTLAIDLDATDEAGRKIFDDSDKILNKLIHRLKKETNSRVVKTVIAESKRHSSSDNIIQRMKEHLVAMKNAEDGASQAKQIENELRKLNKFTTEQPTNQRAKEIQDSLKDFVMAEVDGHFVVRTEHGPDITLDEILETLKSLYN